MMRRCVREKRRSERRSRGSRCWGVEARSASRGGAVSEKESGSTASSGRGLRPRMWASVSWENWSGGGRVVVREVALRVSSEKREDQAAEGEESLAAAWRSGRVW